MLFLRVKSLCVVLTCAEIAHDFYESKNSKYDE